MWHKVLFIPFCLLIGSGFCFAQDPMDSMGLHEQDQYRQHFSVLKQAALDKKKYSKYGRLLLQYSGAKGGLRQAQQAYQKQNIQFYTEGWTQLQRFHVAGTFMFSRKMEDSLANNLRSDQDPLAPFYYFAGKAGNFNRQNYKAEALLAYELLPKRFAPLMKLDYQTHWTTGNVDPRPDVKIFSIKYKPGFMWSPQGHRIELNGIFGHSIQEVSLSYKNRNFQESLLYPERIHYLNLGYGYASIKDSSRMRKFRRYRGAELSYSKSFKKLDFQAELAYEHVLEESTHDMKSRKTYSIRDRFYLNTYRFHLLMDKRGVHTQQQWRLSGVYQSGYDGARDFSPDFQRINYELVQKQFQGDYLISWHKGRSWEKELEGSLAFQGLAQQDYAQGNKLDVQNFTFALNLHNYWKDSQGNRYILHIGPSYRLPGQVTLEMQDNAITPFTRQVIFTDYYYALSQILGANLGFEYIASQWIKGIPLGLSAQYRGLFKLNTQEASLEGARMPEGSRNQIQIGLHLYL